MTRDYRSGNPLVAVVNFYLYSNMHISLGAVALAYLSGILLKDDAPFFIYPVIFCATFVLYNSQRLVAAFFERYATGLMTERKQWISKNKWWLAVLVLAATAGGIGAFLQVKEEFSPADITIPFLIAVLYAIPLIPTGQSWKRLRDIPYLKVFLIGFVWAWVTVLIPVRQTGYDCCEKEQWFELGRLLWFLISFCFIVAITVPFDIRDYYDDAEKLRTIPGVTGVRGAQWIAVLFLILASALMMLFYFRVSSETIIVYRFGYYAAAFIIWALITSLLIFMSTPERHDYFYSFVMDGTIFLLWILMLSAGYIERFSES
ncbi:MAG: hypothetical protein Fur0041_01330 [Bacteroidia bacterium]